jgi:hypothetical protein
MFERRTNQELISNSRREKIAQSVQTYGSHLVSSVVKVLDKITESPPPDKHDIMIHVEESFPTLNVPIPNDPEIHKTFSNKLGKPVDDKLVDNFLETVWSEEKNFD